MFQPGDLLICISNGPGLTGRNRNALWNGILPVVGNYYTWREYNNLCPGGPYVEGWVEEIISPIANNGIEYTHPAIWYKKVEDTVNITELMEESKAEHAY